jgi:hypothetical protein
MLTQSEDHSEQFQREKNRLGIIFGLVAGLTYTIALWGVDGFKLSMANAIFPWAKLALGIIPVLAICILAGWAAVKLENALLSALVWFFTGVGLCFFASHLPFQGMDLFYKWFNPELGWRTALPFNSGVASRFSVLIVVCAAVSLIGGIFYKMLIDSAHNAQVKVGVLLPLGIWIVVIICMASPVDYMIQMPLREPLVAVNKLVDKKISSLTTPVTKEEARTMHLAALNGLEEIIQSPRHLILARFDSSLIMTNVDINFDGIWVDCTVFANTETEPPAQQPVYCKEIE